MEKLLAEVKRGQIIGRPADGEWIGFGVKSRASNLRGPKAQRAAMLSVYAEILEEERVVATLSQKTDFGEWVKWENAMAVNLRWEHLLNKSDSYLKFVLCATEDVLPTPSVLKVWKQWNANDGKCPLGCGRAGSPKHILRV